jgi:hypothetical protein
MQNIRRVQELTKTSEAELLSMRGLGSTSVEEIKNVLASRNLALRNNREPKFPYDDCPLPQDREFGKSDESGHDENVSADLEENTANNNYTITLYDLIDIQDVGPRGALTILGLLDITESERPNVEIPYPSKSLPFIPETILLNPQLLDRIKRLMARSNHAADSSPTQDPREVLKEELVTSLGDVFKDHRAAQILLNIPVSITSDALSLLDLSESAQTQIEKSSSLLDSSADLDEFWRYVEGRFSSNDRRRRIEILRGRWEHGKTLESIGDAVGVTRERVRQLEIKARTDLKKIFELYGNTGIVNRLTWVETQLYDSLELNGGYACITTIEQELGWAAGSIDFWFTLNISIGILNDEEKKVSGPSKLGRLTLDDGFLSTLDHKGRDSWVENPSETIKDIVGPTGIMRLSDLLNSLGQRYMNPDQIGSAILDKGKAFERRGDLVVLDGPNSSNNECLWVAVGLTPAACNIARAILNAKLNRRNPVNSGIGINDPLIDGLRSDLIYKWLEEWSSDPTSIRGIEAVCSRFPNIFVQTGLTSWGLRGSGARELDNLNRSNSAMADVSDAIKELLQRQYTVTKLDVIRALSGTWSGGWVLQMIDAGLADGYLINRSNRTGQYALDLGVEIPELIRYQTKRRTQTHGELLGLVVSVLKAKPNGISDDHVICAIRETLPECSSSSISVYLRHNLKDILEITANGNYRLTEQAIQEIEEGTLTAREVLIKVLSEADRALTIEEITALSQRIRPLHPISIGIFLSSNQAGLFSQDEQGRYTLSETDEYQ